MIAEADVYRHLQPIFDEVFDRQDIAATPDLSAKDVEGWDSFKQIELILATEQRFSMKFTSKEIDSMSRLSDLVAAVAARGTA